MLIYFYRNLIKGRCILKNVSLKNIQKDIISGIIVALVSIPISMGYAQIAGLPAVYGLYCSILPVLIYGLVTSSPQFVFGVDATPAALVGGTLATLGIVSGSEEAKAVVPAITLVAALWLLVFFFIKAGRIVNYISTPVMGGFISGIGVTIILMQAAKLFGGNAGTGEAIKLLIHIAGEIVQSVVGSAWSWNSCDYSCCKEVHSKVSDVSTSYGTWCTCNCNFSY